MSSKSGQETTEAGPVLDDREFVRGRTQLAPYDPAKNATGHRLRGFEARTAYGEHTLREAVEYGSAILAATPTAAQSALKRRREELGVSALEAGRILHLPVEDAEIQTSQQPIGVLETLALHLGLDERMLAFDVEAGADRNLGVRLRTLQAEPSIRLSAAAVLALAESGALVRIQNRLADWLGLLKRWNDFKRSADYGYKDHPAYQVGYDLAEVARRELHLGDEPIPSMRELTEDVLGIPVIQRKLPQSIAGATISNGDDRGVVLNIVGANELVWVRRATLAHELGHLLFDPQQSMQSVRVDLYAENELNPETGSFTDYVEQRANAFAIAFLAPPRAVRKLVNPPFAAEAVVNVMQTFGLSATAARYHLANTYWRAYEVPWFDIHEEPEPQWIAAENYALDWFAREDIPLERRGRFAGLVAACYRRGLISADTAELYLGCSVSDSNLKLIEQLYPLPSGG